MKTILFSFGLLLILVLVACASAPTATPTPVPTQSLPTATAGAPGIPHARVPFLSFGTWQTNVTYCQDGAQALQMDVYYPDSVRAKPAPVGIFLHLYGGDKNQVDVEVVEQLVGRGYLVAAVNWRTPPQSKMPLGLQDAKCAVRHLRAKAAQYQLDSNRIAAWGCSGGGSIAALLGLTDARAGLEGTGGYLDQSSRIQAVATRDAAFNVHTAFSSASDLETLFGVSSFEDPILKRINPTDQISQDAPPFLLFASDSDNHISPKQAHEFADRLKTGGVKATVVDIQGSDHCATFGNPSAKERAKMIADFFDKSLH